MNTPYHPQPHTFLFSHPPPLLANPHRSPYTENYNKERAKKLGPPSQILQETSKGPMWSGRGAGACTNLLTHRMAGAREGDFCPLLVLSSCGCTKNKTDTRQEKKKQTNKILILSFLELHLQHMEVPRLGVESEL